MIPWDYAKHSLSNRGVSTAKRNVSNLWCADKQVREYPFVQIGNRLLFTTRLPDTPECLFLVFRRQKIPVIKWLVALFLSNVVTMLTSVIRAYVQFNGLSM